MESLESRVAYLEKLVRTQTDRIEGLANLVDSFDGYIRQSQKTAEITETYTSFGCDDCFDAPTSDECYDN